MRKFGSVTKAQRGSRLSAVLCSLKSYDVESVAIIASLAVKTGELQLLKGLLNWVRLEL